MLIESGAEVNAKDENSRTALHWAAENDDLEIVKILVESGADTKAKNRENLTPLDLADKFGKHFIASFQSNIVRDKANVECN